MNTFNILQIILLILFFIFAIYTVYKTGVNIEKKAQQFFDKSLCEDKRFNDDLLNFRK